MIEQVVFTIYGLVAYLVISHVFFLFVINKLVNKVMSRNFYEYQQRPRNEVAKAQPEEPVVPDYLGRIFS